MLRTDYDSLSDTTDALEQIAQEVVDRYAADLDAFVQQADTFLDDIRDGAEFSDYDLQRMVLRIPILLYRLADGISRTALEADIAKAAAGRLRSEYLPMASGKTAAERSADADLQVDSAWRLADLTKNANLRLKQKAEYGLGLYEAIKKVMSARDSERAVFKSDAATARRT